MTGIEPRPQRWEARVLPLCHRGPSILVEASPWDIVWGIGRYASDPKSKFKKYWRVKNWLGYILTDVRDQILMS